MKTSSITIILSLVTSAVSRIPSLTQPPSILSFRGLAPAGCTGSTGDVQDIELYSSTKMFVMRVPTNGDNYNLGKPDAQLQCRGPTSSTQSGCQPCWDKMDHVVLAQPGYCSFALTDDNGKLSSVQIDHTQGMVALPKPGYLALVTCYEPQEKTTRSTKDAGLSCDQLADAAIKLDTGSENYVLLVPANQTIFDIIGPDSRLGCIGPLMQENLMCQACNFPVQSIEVGSEAGTCAFNFSGYANLVYHSDKNGILSLSSATQIWSVACGLANVPFGRRQDLLETAERGLGVRVQGPDCLTSAYGVTFNTTETDQPFNQTYMAVPSDQQYYNLEGQSAQLGCYSFRQLDTDPCRPCYDYKIVSLYVSEHLWECRFKIAGWTDVLVWPMWHTTPMDFDPPIKVIGVQCGLGERWLSIPAAADAGDVTVDTRMIHSNMLARYNPSSAEFLCSDSGYNISVFTSDGNVYCPPVPVDFEFHPMSDLSCLRPVDHVLINCTQIGAAIAVNSVGAWGPCIYFTEDHRSFFTDFITSPIVQAQILPGNAISGISCGSGLAG